jgi:hypothetical protein
MTGKRIPKQDEVWTWNGEPRTVLVVHGDNVAVEGERGLRLITTVDNFVARYTPPEPTVTDSIRFRVDEFGLDFDEGPYTHRIEVLTDGTVRLVEVDG